MVFSSIDFLFLFLPLFLLTQAWLPWRNATFLVASLFFYFVGEGVYTAVIVFSAVANYAFGRLVGASAEPRAKKAALAAGVTVNLALLVFFKYAGFIAHNAFGAAPGSWITTIHLPLGISFFTFHAISYLVDVYRGDARAERSLANLSLYLLMFPQLIAGPILRFRTVAARLRRRTVHARHVAFGLSLFALGLGEKVLLADTLAGVCDPLFARAATLSTGTAWLAAVTYALQILFDFGGYSTMAIGLGLATGFRFPRNFNFPYTAQSITEFWRRWHMSLSRWFRDYLYIPLGGNRGTPAATYRNLLIVFLLCGLWHGAAWTFVVWGAYHGALLVAERLVGDARIARVPRVARHAYALAAILAGWVLFRASNLAEAGVVLGKMIGIGAVDDVAAFDLLSGEAKLALAAGLVLCLPVLPRNAKALRYALAIVVFAAAVLKIYAGAYSPFIYFRF
jgi:alginate O-acetyltransferase complex protein AlgI